MDHLSKFNSQIYEATKHKSIYFNDAIALTVITLLGIFGNLAMVLSIMLRKSLRKVVNMFLMHHCFINLVQCCLFIPFIMALLKDSEMLRGCELLGGAFVTMVTANVLNISAMTACEAYRFEDFVQEQNSTGNRSLFFGRSKPKSSKSRRSVKAHSTASFACVIFGLVMIWLASIILHLGITLIGSDSKQFYNHAIRNCFFAIGDKQTYILYLMWIILTTVSLVLTLIYVKKIYRDISERKNASLKFFITTPLFFKRGNENSKSPNRIESFGSDESLQKNKKSNSNRNLVCNDLIISSMLFSQREKLENEKRRYDLIKQILQRIKIQ